MRALSIRQPYAELILRGIKTVEYRTQPTRVVGERFHIYATKKKRSVAGGQWPVKSADNIVVPPEKPPQWMIELAEQVGMIEPHLLNGALLPTGVIVGSAVIEKVSQVDSRSTGSGRAMYRWHLANVERAKKLRKPNGHPQPVWFKPF
ncbi:MAG: ASCH domain-containing protein [Tepidisphaeraceae bacterium]